MKLENDDGTPIGNIVSVLIARDDEDILLATSSGNAIRFPVDELRVFQGRASTGVRGISFKGKDGEDLVVDACILAHTDSSPIERDIYLAKGTLFTNGDKLANENGESRIPASVSVELAPEADKPDRVKVSLSVEKMAELSLQERFLLTVTARGFGKRSSSHEYRVTGRGGSGVVAAVVNETTGSMVACLPVEHSDELVIVTNGGQAIRTRVSDVSIFGRATRGVRVFSLPDDQRVAGVARVACDDTGPDLSVDIDSLRDGAYEAEPANSPEELSE